MKSISIYMALIILFNVNLRSVCVGGDKDKQNTRHGTTQEGCNEEKKDQKQKEKVENQSDHEISQCNSKEQTQNLHRFVDIPWCKNPERKSDIISIKPTG